MRSNCPSRGAQCSCLQQMTGTRRRAASAASETAAATRLRAPESRAERDVAAPTRGFGARPGLGLVVHNASRAEEGSMKITRRPHDAAARARPARRRRHRALVARAVRADRHGRGRLRPGRVGQPRRRPVADPVHARVAHWEGPAERQRVRARDALRRAAAVRPPDEPHRDRDRGGDLGSQRCRDGLVRSGRQDPRARPSTTCSAARSGIGSASTSTGQAWPIRPTSARGGRSRSG